MLGDFLQSGGQQFLDHRMIERHLQQTLCRLAALDSGQLVGQMLASDAQQGGTEQTATFDIRVDVQ